MPLSFLDFTSALTGIFSNFASVQRTAGAFLLALPLVFCLCNFSPLVFAAEDSADLVDQQRAYLDQTMHDIERQRAEQEAEKKAEAEWRLKMENKRTERRLAEQLKGLSGTLSGLPELPNFNGTFERQSSDDQRPKTND